MTRYLIERTFDPTIHLPAPGNNELERKVFFENNRLDGVTWVHSYIAPDRKKSYCIYDAPHPEALRRAARRNGLPIDRITEVSILHPYPFYPDASASGSREEE